MGDGVLFPRMNLLGSDPSTGGVEQLYCGRVVNQS